MNTWETCFSACIDVHSLESKLEAQIIIYNLNVVPFDFFNFFYDTV